MLARSDFRRPAGRGADGAPMLYFFSILDANRHVLKLIATLSSPFARKVAIALAEKKYEYQLVEATPWGKDNALHTWNPLGKLPVLLLDDGSALYDSRVIVEYLDTMSPVSRLIPEAGRQRIIVKRWEALADGVCDAALAIVIERRRPVRQQSNDWIARQQRKIDAGIAELARDLEDKAWCNGEAYSLADIATGCALGYLDLRHPDLRWRDAYPNLARLAERLGKRASFLDSAPAKDA